MEETTEEPAAEEEEPAAEEEEPAAEGEEPAVEEEEPAVEEEEPAAEEEEPAAEEEEPAVEGEEPAAEEEEPAEMEEPEEETEKVSGEEVSENPEEKTEEALIEEEDSEAEETEEDEEAAMPEYRDKKTVDGVDITIYAPEGTFPYGTTVDIVPSSADVLAAVKAEAEAAIADDESKEVSDVIGFDFTFRNVDGEEIEPANGNKVDISYKLPEIEDDVVDVLTYHVDDSNNIEEVDSNGTKEVVFSASEFSGYVQAAVTSSGTGDEDADYWDGSVKVFWDTTNGSAGTGTGSNDTVTSVKLSGTSVSWGDSDSTSWSGGSALSTYYGNILKGSSKMIDTSMSITAAAGYYVTKIIVACAPNAGGTAFSPYKCGTWTSGNNLVATYDLSQSTYGSGVYTLTFNVNSIHFSHNGATTPNAYFILIQTAAVPTPLYVEYDYGEIGKIITNASKNISDTAFGTASGWTVANSGNVYGSGDSYTSGVLTDDTQFAYQYPKSNTSVIENWKHYANSISDAAIKDAAAVGYEFDGWAVTWYNTCSVTENATGSYNNYTMAFNNTYMTGTAGAGEAVQLPTNVRLVAKWKSKPVTETKGLDVTKSSSLAKASGNTTEGKAEVGDTIKYTITVKNTGNVKLTGIKITDTMSNGGTVTWTGSDFASAGTDPTTTEFDLEKSGDEGDTQTFYATYTVTADDVAKNEEIYNTATAKAGEDGPSDTGKDEGQDPVEDKSLDIEKSSTLTETNGDTTDGKAEVGDVITYTITVKNDGNVKYEDILITDTMSNGATLENWSPSNPTTTKFNLDVNETKTFTGTYTVTQDDVDAQKTIINKATAGDDEDEDDGTDVEPVPTNPGSNPTTIVDEDTPLADLPEDVEIEAEDTPLADGTDIADEDVPMADVPQTGDSTGSWYLMTMFSALGLLWLALDAKKRKAESR